MSSQDSVFNLHSALVVLTTAMRCVRRDSYTLFLFLKSDIRSILLPILSFAAWSTRSISTAQMGHAAIWTVLHLLQFCVSNQRSSTQEDAYNKSWRPLPSRRISEQNAAVLRWALFPVCFILSAFYGVAPAGALLSAATLLHNEGKLDNHWVGRNLLNAAGYLAFDLGATGIASQSRYGLEPRIINSILISAAIILTTVHAQDIGDEEGDAAQGRKTLPIVAPLTSRLSVCVATLAWSVLLSLRCSGQYIILSGLVWIMSIIVSARLCLLKGAKEDKRTYTLYNIWLSMARTTTMLTC